MTKFTLNIPIIIRDEETQQHDHKLESFTQQSSSLVTTSITVTESVDLLTNVDLGNPTSDHGLAAYKVLIGVLLSQSLLLGEYTSKLSKIQDITN